MSEPLRLGVLVSGQGSNLQALLDASSRGEIPARVVVVVADRPDAFALVRARAAGVPAHIVERATRDRASFERELAARLEEADVDLVCLAGFLRILSGAFVARFRNRMLNIHPSLLPKFGGKGMYGERVHLAVLEAGERESGCTVHFVTEEPDAGPIVLQARVPVLRNDTAATLAARVAEAEHRCYAAAIGIVAAHRPAPARAGENPR
jgi:phosphoribosylglycinamide formyltransferase-1